MKNAVPAIPFEAQAYQDFVRGLRTVWRTDAYAASVAEAQEKPATTVRELEDAMRESRAYQLYGWLERRSQQFKYLGRWGMASWLEGQRAVLERVLAEAARVHPERLRLQPGFAVPDYVRAADTHQHPGATWTDAVGAFAYEWGTDGFSFSMGDSDRPLSWYAETLAREAAPRAVLDVGCTAGKSSRALKRAMPEARVEACDVAGPAIALAHMRSVEAGLEITYTQCSAEALDYADDSFDLVSCHWLFHEMPPEAVRRALAEMRRVLRPGGVLAIYDMHLMPGGLVGAWLHHGYAARNNEPFAAAFSAMDLRAELAPLGFEEVAIDVSDLQRGEFDMGKLPPARTHFMTLATARVAR